MDKFDYFIHKGLAYVWLALLIGCAVGVIFGAWWHFFTGLISWVMYRCCLDSAKEAERDADIIKK